MDEGEIIKELEWIGSSRKDMQALPLPVQRTFGYALYFAQLGDKPPEAKILKGFDGTGVLELIEDHKGDTYRAVYRGSKSNGTKTYAKEFISALTADLMP